MAPNPKTYRDDAKCPGGHKFVAVRRTSSSGNLVQTYCPRCKQSFKLLAGPLPSPERTTKK